MIPWAHVSPQPKWHLDWFSHVCRDDRSISVYFTMVWFARFSLKTARSHGGSGPHVLQRHSTQYSRLVSCVWTVDVCVCVRTQET